MKLLDKIIKYNLLTALAFVFAFSSCVNEDLSGESPVLPDDQIQGTVQKPNRFIAFKINIAGDVTSRADNIYDAEHPDATSPDYIDGVYFNKGLPFERALYFPKDNNVDDPGEEGHEIEIAQVDEASPVDNEYNQYYHFIILFNEDGSPKTELLKLNLDSTSVSDKEEDDITVYSQFFDSQEEEENPFINFSGSALVVLNASYDLQLQVAEELGNYETDTQALTKISTFLPSPKPLTPDFFMFLRDHKGNYILDDDGNKFFTMSSSIVIRDGKVLAASSTTTGHSPFQLYNNLEEARKNPTHLYVERLQSKFTLLFQENSKIWRGTDNISLSQASDKPESYFYLTDADLSKVNISDNWKFKPVNRIWYYPNGRYENDGEYPIKYVASYTRSNSIGNRNPVTVKTTTKWKINVIGWGINGLESEEYLFKKLNPGADYTENNNWFSPTNISYRTFWAEDPHYSGVIDYYPHQFRPAYVLNNEFELDLKINPSVESSNTLDYFNFSTLSRKNVRIYVPENTFSKELITSSYDALNHLRVGSHLILTAQLLIDGEGDFEYPGIYNSENFDNDGLIYSSLSRVRTKYLMNDIFWEESAYMNYFIEYMGYWMHESWKQGDYQFGPNDGIFYINKYGAKAEWGSFKIENIEIEGGDAMVWVVPKEDVTLYSFNPDAKVNEDPYREVTFDKYKRLVFEHKNYLAKRFNEGRMYYATGSEHHLNKNSSVPVTGDYGTVRNNWYYFIIDGMTKPGTAVAEPSQLIIPNNEPYETGLGVSLRLLEWHREFIDVDVKDQR